jgi:hypothetical protein
MKARVLALALAAAAILFHGTPAALASGGNYVLQGGTPAEQQQVRDALNASTFNWSAVPETITITIGPIADSQSVPGQIWIDSGLLDSGELSWGVVQNEYAHEVDFFLLDDAQRAELTTALGATAWCYGDAPGLTLEEAGCERFASTLAVSYWQNPQNCIEQADDVATIAGSTFRTLLASMIGSAATPTTPASPATTTTATTVVNGTRQPVEAKNAGAGSARRSHRPTR